jgi:AcrR family transcriptional regulator
MENTHASPADLLLDAAEIVAVRRGIGNLTLDAVALEAGMSKGGLLHHFPSKDRLIEGMVVRHAKCWRNCYMQGYADVPEGPGRMARGLISRCLVDAKCWTEQLRSSTSAVFAALAQNPSLIQPMREAYSELHGMIAKDGLPSGVADVVLAAIDGLWLNWVLGLLQVDQSHVDRLRRGLQMLLAPYVPGVAGRSVKAGKADKAKSAKTTKAAPSASKLKGRAKR